MGAASVLHPGRWSQPEHPRAARITYARARLMGNEETFGPVTFCEADFVLPNALADDGHPFPHRDELRRLARGHPNGW